MLEKLNVKVGPQFYRYGTNAIDNIPKLLKEYNANNILILHGNVSWKKAKPYFSSILNDVGFNLMLEKFGGECSFVEGQRVLDIIKKNNIDFIIGVGGGKLCDLVLHAAELANIPFGVVPTLASNCAPWTPLAVMYKENGLAEGKTFHINRQAAFLLMDPRIIIDAPIDYFIAGIADTIAKWYESDLILQQDMCKNEPMLQMARYSAKMCKDTLLSVADKAIEDMKNQEITSEFLIASEIIISIAGLVGGFGDVYSRNTAAHSIHDAISAYLPEVHKYLHGEKVAYGILYQLSLEENWSEIDRLLPFYKSHNLPISLTEMGVYPMDDEKLEKVVDLINGKAKVHLLPIDTSRERLKEAIIKLENYLKEEE